MQIFTALPVWFWIGLSALFFAAGEYVSKLFAINPGWSAFLLFIVVDIISAATWIPAIFEKNQLSVTGVVWSVASVMATVAVGALLFHEKVTTMQVVGLVLGVVAVGLLSI